jgi:prophage maintenance system killer protein
VNDALRLAPGAAVRDLAALEAALHTRMHTALNGEADFLELAARLADAVLQARASNNGNAQAARSAAALFLAKNGIEYTEDFAEAVEMRRASQDRPA